MIEELCSRLKEKRRELDYSIEEVVKKTKLSPSVIKDIEEANLSNIGSAYVKGFIKIYASFLGVAIDEALREDNFSKIEEEPPKKVKKTKKPISPKFKKVVAFSLLGIILFLSSLSFLTRPKRAPQTARKHPQVKKEVPPLLSTFKPSFKRESSEIVASLTVKRNCYLRVKVDGKLFFEGVLQKDTVETWRGNKEIEFKLQDGSAVYLEVNGKPLPPLTAIRQPIKSLKINPSGISVDK